MSWWEQAVIYQVYPRSFQDSDGDGIGDLRGLESRLGYLAGLGVDALWLSPIYPSPLADMGYDVADHSAVAPEMGTLAGFDRMIGTAHGLGLKVLLDVVPSHTSIEHRWFREHPEYYVWADEPPNNWVAAFGGPAWTLDPQSGRYYLHSFYPEQPDLDWRVPEVRRAMGDVFRFWTARGVDGFRVDAVQQLMKDERLRDDPLATTPFLLPLGEGYSTLRHVHSEAGPEIGTALEAMREAAGDAFLVGEVYRPTADLSPYLEHFDSAFAFELLHSPLEPERVAEVITAGSQLPGLAWALSNHDFPRLVSRFGRERAAAAAVLHLTLPGPVFLYQGDEIGMADGPGADPPADRAGRDACRHPMLWDDGPNAGFSSGEPWLPATPNAAPSVAAQTGDPSSMLELHRRLIALRRDLSGPLEEVTARPLLTFRRGTHTVAINLGETRAELPERGEVVLSTGSSGSLAPGEGAVLRDI